MYTDSVSQLARVGKLAGPADGHRCWRITTHATFSTVISLLRWGLTWLASNTCCITATYKTGTQLPYTWKKIINKQIPYHLTLRSQIKNNPTLLHYWNLFSPISGQQPGKDGTPPLNTPCNSSDWISRTPKYLSAAATTTIFCDLCSIPAVL
jgi:hypothetical protein